MHVLNVHHLSSVVKLLHLLSISFLEIQIIVTYVDCPWDSGIYFTIVNVLACGSCMINVSKPSVRKVTMTQTVIAIEYNIWTMWIPLKDVCYSEAEWCFNKTTYRQRFDYGRIVKPLLSKKCSKRKLILYGGGESIKVIGKCDINPETAKVYDVVT